MFWLIYPTLDSMTEESLFSLILFQTMLLHVYTFRARKNNYGLGYLKTHKIVQLLHA